MRSLKDLVKAAVFSPLIPQRAWEALQHLSLRGMNIGGGSHVQESGEKWLIEQVAQSFQGEAAPVVLDVGANVGSYAEEILRTLRGHVRLLCLEPAARPFAILKAKLEQSPNVQLHQIGLHDREERLVLHSNSANSAMASLYARDLAHLGMELSEKEEISLTTLDALCAANGIDHIDLLKLDCEGHELKALGGAAALLAAGAIQLIQFEFGGCNLDSRTYFRDFFRILAPRYLLFRLLPRGLAPIPRYDERLELFTTTNFIAVLAESPLATRWN